MKPFHEEWERCAPWLAAALEYCGGTHELEDVRRGVLRWLAGDLFGAFQFWPASRSVIVTELVPYPRLLALNVFLAGGDLSELQTMQGSVEGWARTVGCRRIQAYGRTGWNRVFRDYQKTNTVFAKEL